MPLISQDKQLELLGQSIDSPQRVGVDKEQKKEAPSTGEVFGAAFRRDNIIASAISNGAQDQRITNSDYDPVAKTLGTPYEPFIDRVVFADSDEELEAVYNQIDKEQRDNEILANGGWASVVGSLSAGIADPTLLIPGVAGVRSAATLGRIGQGAVSGSLLAAGAVGTQEYFLQDTQLTREQRTSIESVMFAATAGGIFGGIAGAFARDAQRVITNLLDIDNPPKVVVDGDTVGVEVPLDHASAAETKFTPEIRESLAKQQKPKNINEKVLKASAILDSPIIKGFRSKSETLAAQTSALFEHSFILNKNKPVSFTVGGETKVTSKPTPVSMETKMKIDAAAVIKMNADVDNLYLDLAKSRTKVGAAVGGVLGKNIKYGDFSEMVAMAMRRGDVHEIPQVQAAARRIRGEMDKVTSLLKKHEILPEDLDPKTAISYLSRKWNKETVIAKRDILRKKISDYYVSQGTAENTAIRNAETTIDNILGLGDDRLEISRAASDMLRSKTTSFTKERALLIDDSEIEEFLINDGVGIAQGYLTQASSMIRFREFLEEMGAETIGDVKKKVREDLAPGLEAGKITLKEVERDLALVDTQASIMLGQYTKPSRFDDAFRVLRLYQTARLLGGIVVSSLADTATPIFKHGLGRTVVDGYAPLIRNFKAAGLSRDQLSDFNIGLELYMNETLRSIADGDFAQVGRNQTTAQKVSNVVSQTFSTVTGFNLWQRAQKRIAGSVAQARIIRAALSTKTLPESEIERLASLGIGETELVRIKEMFERNGQREGGSFIANFDRWSDTEIKDLFGAAVLKDTDSTVITPSVGDVPQFAQGSELAKTIFQFKTFGAAATNKILLSALNRRDKDAALGLVSLVATGSMVYIIKETLAGRTPSTEPETLLKEGIARSGVAGLMGDVAFAFVPGLNSSRFADMNAVKFLIGPTVGQAGDVAALGKELTDGRVTEKDLGRAAKMLPFQNLLWLRLIMNQINDEEKKQ